MTEEVKAKSRVSNRALLITLGVLILVIAALIIGIIVVNVLGDNLFMSSYDKAKMSCEIIEQGIVNNTDDVYRGAVATFETASNDSSVNKNQDFRSCYVSLRRYYDDIGATDRADYYDSIVQSMVTDEERRETEELLNSFMAESEENRQLVEDLQRQHEDSQTSDGNTRISE